MILTYFSKELLLAVTKSFQPRPVSVYLVFVTQTFILKINVEEKNNVVSEKFSSVI